MSDAKHHRGPAPEHKPAQEADPACGPDHDRPGKSQDSECPEGYADEQTKAPQHPDVDEDDENPEPTPRGH